MTRLETLTALLVLKQPKLLGKLTVELNGAHYVWRAMHTPEGVTVRFGQGLDRRDLGELLPRVAEAALGVVFSESRAALVRERDNVATWLGVARALERDMRHHEARLAAFAGHGSSLMRDASGEWHTTWLAAQFLLEDARRKVEMLARRAEEIEALLAEEPGEDQ
jgi:hypothetical protein